MARPDTTTGAWRRIAPAAWSALVVLAVVVAHLPSFMHRLMDGDEAVYGSIASLMNMGGQLYGAGGVDNKPPGIFWVYAMTFRVFGTYQMTAVHAVGLAVVLATCLLIFVMARDLASLSGVAENSRREPQSSRGLRAGLLAALFYGILTAAGNPRLLASNTEVFMMLPLTASVLLTLRRRWFWAGALMVAAGVFRQSAAVNVLLTGLAILWLEPRAGRWRALGLFAGGLTAGLAAGTALIGFTGSVGGFWRWTVGSLYLYATSNWTPSLILSRARDSILLFAVDMAVIWIAALALAWRWRALTEKERLMVVWLGVAMAGSLAGGHLSWHYFIQVMGPLAVLAALAFDRLSLRRWVAIAAAAGIMVPAATWWAYDIGADPLTYDSGPSIPQHEAVAAYIREHTSPSDRVFVWGVWPALYVEADRNMSSRFPGFLRGFARGSGLPPNNWDTTPDVWPLLQSDLAANPPALIVDTSTADWSSFAPYPMKSYPVVADLVAAHYRMVATIDGVVIYARTGS